MLLGLFWNYHLDERDAVSCCRELNDEVAAVQTAYADRYCGMAVLPMRPTGHSPEEADRAGRTWFTHDCDCYECLRPQS